MNTGTISLLQEKYATFCRTHPYTRRVINGTEWQYIDCGPQEPSPQTTPTLLLLPGAPGRADTSFEQITQFETHYRVLALSYPASLHTVAQLVDAIGGIVDAEKIAKAHVLGGSYSGIIAQCLARCYPDRVGKLILSHTGVPRRGRAVIFSLLRHVISLLPIGVLRQLMDVGQQVFFQEVITHDRFWHDYFRQIIASFGKAEYESRLAVYSDFDRHYRFSSRDVPSHDMLIIEADNDTLVSATERALLRAAYPHAQVYTFHESAHSAWVTRHEHYMQLIMGFLADENT